jgi:hypothetical protein
MNHRWIIGLSLLLLVSAPAVPLLFAHDHEESPINMEMEIINDHYRTLRRQARGNRFDESTLGLLAEMQLAALNAMHMTFPKADALPQAERQTMIVDYRRDMAAFIKALLDAEIALLEDRKEDAGEIIGNLGAMKADGHEKFHPEGE